MDELSTKWENLSDIAQASITELLAGKHQGNIMSSLMSNFDTARAALETSLTSSGSAMAEHEKWSKSLEAQLLRLKATWQSLSQSFLQSDFLKLALDATIGLVNGLDKLISTFGALNTLVAGAAIWKVVSKISAAAKTMNLVGGIKTIGDMLSVLSVAFPNAAKGIGIFTTALKSGVGVTGVLKGALSGLWTVVAAHPILATVAAVGLAIAAFSKWNKSKEELAKEVDELTSKFKEQHNELTKGKSSFKSDAARYAQLSKGVDQLGRNVSLTTDEYSEYQSVVNKIADQVPSLISGYDSQGNAILNVKGNVEELVRAYENLIKAENRAVLDKTEDIEDDFGNVVANAKKSDGGLFSGAKLSSRAYKAYKEMLNSEDPDSFITNAQSNKEYWDSGIRLMGQDIKAMTDLLEENGIERQGNWLHPELDVDFIARAFKENKDVVLRVLDDFYADLEEETEGMKSLAQAAISNAFDLSDSDFYGMNDTLKGVARQIVNGFDYEFFAKLTEEGKSVEEYVNSMLKQLNALSGGDVDQIEAAFNLQTKFNNGDVSYGEFIHGLEDAGKIIDRLNLTDDVKSQLKLSLGLNEEGLVEEYETLINRLTATSKDNISKGNIIGLGVEEAKKFVDSMSAEELSVVTDIIPEFTPLSNEKLKEEFDKLESGGSVNLALRPEVDTSVLKNAGWKDAGEGAATVFTSTFSNEAGNVAMNFTPIIADENGNHIGTLSPKDLQEYAEGVIAGTREDDLNLQIGAKFEGEDAIAQAENAAEQIHKLQDYYYNGVTAQLNDAIERALAINGLLSDFNFEVETAGLDALNTALKESKSATGLTAESISALKARYEDLDGYNVATLFEETANGIRLNSSELSKLESEYKKINKQDLDETLEKLVGEYDNLTSEINNCKDASKRADLYAQRDSIINQINDTATLAAQYEGLTSAYKEWQSAQEAGQDRDQYESIISGRTEIEEEMYRGWLDDATVEYLELLSGKDLTTAGIDAQIEAYKELDKTINGSEYSIWDFFTEDDDGNATSDGVFNFFEAVKDVAGETAAYVKDGKYNFDFEGFEYDGKTGDAAIAAILGTSEELVQIMLKAAEDAGFVVNIKGDYTELANLKDEAEVANDRMKELEATAYTFNFDSTNIKDLNEQITEAEKMLGNLKGKDGKLKVGVSEEDYRKAQDMISALIYQKQSLDDSAILHVDTSQANSDIETSISKLQDFRAYANTLELQTSIGADTSEVTANIDTALNYINTLNPTIKTGLGLDTEEVQTAISNIQANIDAGVAIKQEDIDVVNAAISSISNDMMVELGLDTTLIDNYKSTEQTAEGVVNWTNNVKAVTDWINQSHEASGTVTWNNNTENVKTTFFGNGVINWTVSEANGTANVNGTASGRAFKQGNWGINNSGTALGGELGTEILVRDGRWYTIGDTGAEFFNYKKGDIIFNHKQTEELFSNGKVTSGGGRGRAFAEGNAFAVGSNATGFRRTFIENSVRQVVKDAFEEEKKKSGDGSKGSGGVKDLIKDAVAKNTTSSSSSSKDEFEETFDWIEVAISRIERAIDQLDQKANNIYKSWSDRNSALTKEIGKVREEIELQEDAAQRYLQEANSVGLDSSYAEKVRNGTINIEDFKGEGDEKLVEKIKDYQTWYEKYLDCIDAAEELRETEAKLYAQRVENVQTQYDGILGVIEHEKNILDEYIAQNEANAQLVSVNYYNALAKNERENLSKLEEQKAKMLAEMQVAMDSGTITKESEAWYDMVASIDEVTLAIVESNTQLIEYQQTIQQLSWERFDILQEKISSVVEETEFLIELMSSDKLYDDNGKLTDSGMATMGQHGVAYNTHMYQAELASSEAERLKKELAKDPFDTELEERYREMISLQQEHILAAQGEKEAIRDMVEEGINLELDALQERIDKYNEAIDSQKDLYDYQKKVKEQTKEIASIEKQMASYGGNDSEEAKAKIQELKVSLEEAKSNLEESEYDKRISDQQQLLDELYLSYEEILNTRLDNLDALVSDMIVEINTSASSISTTLSEKADSVGYTLSDSMDTIWDANSTKINGVIADYGSKFMTGQTTTNNALNTINTNLQNVINQLNSIAKTNVKSASTSSVAKPQKTNTTTTTTTQTKPKTTTAATIKVGGKINAGSAKIYDYAGAPAETQYFKKDPVYKVLKTDGNWLQVRWHKLTSGITGWFKKSDVKALATGAKRIDSNDMAWTQEKGREYIVRPSDGAILTPVAKGDSVLNATASGNIWNMANSPAEFIRDNLKLSATNVPNNSNVQSNCVQHFENVVFSMPNVRNYEQLLSEMQKDKNFERLILSMSIDRIAGKSSLAKGKSIR